MAAGMEASISPGARMACMMLLTGLLIPEIGLIPAAAEYSHIEYVHKQPHRYTWDIRSWCSNPDATQEHWKGFRCDNGYQWLLPHINSDRGILPGNIDRMRLAMHRLLHLKENLTVAFIGGSITAGAYPIHHDPTVTKNATNKYWPDWSVDVLARFLPEEAAGRVHYVNAAISATTSHFFSLCHKAKVPGDADIIFLEFSVNDEGVGREHQDAMVGCMERLIRSLWKYERKPAIVLMNHYIWFRCGSPLGQHTYLLPSEGASIDHLHRILGEYYDIGVVSVRNAVSDLFRKGLKGFQVERPILWPSGCLYANDPPIPEFDWSVMDKAFYYDMNHPGGMTGARASGEMAAALMLAAAVSVMHRPVTDQERGATMTAGLPHPMLNNNYEAPGDVCFIEEKLHQMMVDQKGFEWTDEGRKGKFGWVGDGVGSYVSIKVDASLPPGMKFTPGFNPSIGINVNFLKSYEHMGIVSVSCESGCKCTPIEIDGNWDMHHSQTFAKAMSVSPHKDCILKLTITEVTNSPDKGHKFKINGITVSTVPSWLDTNIGFFQNDGYKEPVLSAVDAVKRVARKLMAMA